MYLFYACIIIHDCIKSYKFIYFWWIFQTQKKSQCSKRFGRKKIFQDTWQHIGQFWISCCPGIFIACLPRNVLSTLGKKFWYWKILVMWEFYSARNFRAPDKRLMKVFFFPKHFWALWKKPETPKKIRAVWKFHSAQ